MSVISPVRWQTALAFVFVLFSVAQYPSKLPASDTLRFLASESDAFAKRLELIENAANSICIATYQIRDDDSGGQLLAALLDAADRGINVRLLVDAHVNSNNLPKPLMRYLTDRGISIKEIPFDVRNKLELGRPRLHDKLFIVDSANLIIGGRNLEQDYFGLGDRTYIDYDVLASGPEVCTVQSYFEERWREPDAQTPRLVGREAPKMLKKQVHADWNDKPYCEVVCEIEAWIDGLRNSELQASDSPCRPPICVQEHHPCHVEFLRDFSLSAKRAPPSISSRILKEIEQAKHSLIISTPYFVVPTYLLHALTDASKRGVRITILTNSLDSTDQVVVHAGYVNLRRKLIRNGIQLYETKGTETLHAKLIIIDGAKTIVGSHNLDMLSMKRNSEVGLLVNGVSFADDASVLFQSLMNQSTCLNEERLLFYEKRTTMANDDKLNQYQRLRLVAPFIRRYL